MADKKPRAEKIQEELIVEFLESMEDPIHKQILEAYAGNSPVKSMEQELMKLLEEAASDED